MGKRKKCSRATAPAAKTVVSGRIRRLLMTEISPRDLYEKVTNSDTFKHICDSLVSARHAIHQGSFIGCLLLSVLVRCWNLNSPLQEAHGFRQTQTAMTVWYNLHEGATLLHPKVPVLGAPWEILFDFPLYQLCATGLIKLTHLPIDVACRVTNILFFYLSAWLLWLVCRAFFSVRASSVVLLFYVWMPFSILWSRTCMIEYTAISLSLLYLYSMIRWLRSPRTWGWVFLAVIAGGLAAAVKITTLVCFMPAVMVLTILSMKNWRCKDGCSSLPISGWVANLSKLTAAVLIPIACGLTWTAHADRVKNASAATAWLTSKNLQSWNFGTLSQRQDPHVWEYFLQHLYVDLLPYGFCLLPLIALVLLRKQTTERLWLLIAAFVGAVLPPLTFFNLYVVHDYYFCAISPLAALLAGYGFWMLIETLRGRKWIRGVVIGLVVYFSLLPSYQSGWHYLDKSYCVSYSNNEMCNAAKIVQSLTRSTDRVVVAGMDWDPSLLYYAERKGFMFKHQIITDTPSVHTKAYTLLVCKGSQTQLDHYFPKRSYLTKEGDIVFYRLAQ